MKTLKFRCTLLSDMVLNTSAATVGGQTTLDFIPGNNFLGIVAADYDTLSPAEQLEIFHSGKVRFGDGHPSTADATTRSLHVPATFFYPKGMDATEVLYTSQGYSRREDTRMNGKPMQLKQCRSGYCVFEDGEGKTATVRKDFAIKSAYDREHRRAKDSMMYGYESLDKGQTFLFEVEVDNDNLSERIKDELTGIHHIGRSRTAQYGLVKIEEALFNDVPSRSNLIDTVNGKRVAVYADSRLIFLDDYGQPKALSALDAKDLGLDGEMDWALCQVRTFQYAPWNGKRQTRDADRCGIEKGSVFFVKCNDAPSESKYIGSYNNEGFGRVIYNPQFLQYTGDNGKAPVRLLKQADTKIKPQKTILSGTPLLNYISRQRNEHEAEIDITTKVNNFVDDYGKLFTGATFASQWGRIRKIAMAFPTKEGIVNELFDKEEIRHHYPSPDDPKEYDKSEKVGYLVHGVAEKKWKKGGRQDKLRNFIDSFSDGNRVQMAVVNLASEMAKICARNGKD